MVAAQFFCSLINSDNIYRTNLEGERRGGGWIGKEWHSEMLCLPVACQLLFLPSSLQEEQALSLNSFSPTLHIYGETCLTTACRYQQD